VFAHWYGCKSALCILPSLKQLQQHQSENFPIEPCIEHWSVTNEQDLSNVCVCVCVCARARAIRSKQFHRTVNFIGKNVTLLRSVRTYCDVLVAKQGV
jgi:hypothetical protein